MMHFKSNKSPKAWRAGAAALVFGALAACDPVPTGDTTCESPAACEIIALTAEGMRTNIGKNYGGGVVLRNARALGQTLLVDVSLPLSSAAFELPIGQRIIKDFGKNLADGFCGGEFADEFFDMGGVLRGRGFSKDNKLVADQVIRSCGRQ